MKSLVPSCPRLQCSFQRWKLFLCQQDQSRLRSITCLQPHCLFDLLICYHHPHHYDDCYYYFVNLKPALRLGYLESCSFPAISFFFFAVTICWGNTLSFAPGAPLHLQPRWTWEGFQHSRGPGEREGERERTRRKDGEPSCCQLPLIFHFGHTAAYKIFKRPSFIVLKLKLRQSHVLLVSNLDLKRTWRICGGSGDGWDG